MNAKTCVQLFGDNLIGQTMRCGPHIIKIAEIHPSAEIVAFGRSVPLDLPFEVFGHADLTRVEWNPEKNQWIAV